MITIYIDNIKSRIDGDLSLDVLEQISTECSYFIQGSQYSTLCQNGLWDGSKKLFSKKDRTFPTGILYKVKNVLQLNNIEFNLVDTRLAPLIKEMPLITPWPLRKYQEECIDIGLKCTRGVIKAATGSGKSLMIAGTIAKTNVTTLVVTQTATVFNQIHSELEKFLGIPIGKIGDGVCDIKKITVGLIQALVRTQKKGRKKVFDLKPEYKDFCESVQFLGIDECFVGKQSILIDSGSRNISSLYFDYINNKPLPLVVSYNETLDIFENKRIIKVFKNDLRNRNILCITIGHNKIKCTDNHKFLTEKGWLQAKDLKVGDRIISRSDLNCYRLNSTPILNKDQEDIAIGSFFGDGNIQKIKECSYRLRIIHGAKQKDYCAWKASFFNRDIKIVHNNGFSKKDAFVFYTRSFFYDLDLSNRVVNINDDIINKLNLKSLSILYMDNGSINKKHIRIHTNAFSEDINLKLLKRIFILTGALGKVYISRKKNGKFYYYLNFDNINSKIFIDHIKDYIHPNLKYKLGDFYSDNNFSWISNNKQLVKSFGIIDNIEIIKHINNAVYDLEVEDNHNYLVGKSGDGFIAHNCHHISSEGTQILSRACPNAYYRLGLSASPWRDDHLDLLITAVTGKQLCDYSASSLIQQGYLSKPYINLVHFKHKRQPSTLNYKDLYTQEVVDNLERNALICDIASKHIENNNSILISIQRVAHGDILLNALSKKYGSKVRFVCGDDDSELLNQTLKDLDSKKILCAIATSVYKEGVDVKGLEILINANAMNSSVTAFQLVGRVLRKTATKDKVLVYDIYDEGCRWLGEHSISREKIYRTESEYEIKHVGGGVNV